MLPVAFALLSLTTPAQAGDPPPPPVLEEDRIGEEEWRDPADDSAREPARRPERADPAPPPKAPEQAPGPDEGLDELTTLLVHLAALALVSTLILPINYYGTLLTCGLWPCVIWPALSSYAITWSGDFVGKKRAAVLWPLLASVVTGASIAALAGLGAVLMAGLVGAVSSPAGGILFVAAVMMVGGGILCGPCASGTAGAIAYYVVAEPKPPGDKTRFPGLLEPAGPAADEPIPY